MPSSGSVLVPAFACVIGLAACKANTISSNQTNSTAGADVIGPSGGTVSLADGTEVRVPAGALTKDTTISITVAQPGDYPVLSSQYTDVGKVYALRAARAEVPDGRRDRPRLHLQLHDGTRRAAVRTEWHVARGHRRAVHVGDGGDHDRELLLLHGGIERTESRFGAHLLGQRPGQLCADGDVRQRQRDHPGETGCPSDLYCGPIDLSTLADGYATSEMSGGSCTIYFLNLVLAPYQHACGYMANGVDKIGAGLASIQIGSTAPITTELQDQPSRRRCARGSRERATRGMRGLGPIRGYPLREPERAHGGHDNGRRRKPCGGQLLVLPVRRCRHAE